MIIGSLADGLTNAEIRQAYPQLKDEDIRAALAYAAVTLHTDVVAPLGGDQAQVRFDAPQRDITAGQAAVFFQGDLLIGGGIIA